MTEEANPVDAGGAPASESPTPATQDAAYWKNEMHKAVQARQEAKEKLRARDAIIEELKGKLSENAAPKADASPDLKSKLDELTANNEALAAKLEAQTKKYRESNILSKLTAGLPEDRHEAIADLYRANAATLDDGTAEIADVVAKAGELLKAKAAPLFNAHPQPTQGRLPNGGKPPELDVDAERKKRVDALRRIGATGVGL